MANFENTFFFDIFPPFEAHKHACIQRKFLGVVCARVRVRACVRERETFSKTFIFLRARTRWAGINTAFCTMLLAPLPIAPNTCISWEAHLYVFSSVLISSVMPAERFCNPSSFMLYTPRDWLSRFTVPPSDAWNNKNKIARNSNSYMATNACVNDKLNLNIILQTTTNVFQVTNQIFVLLQNISYCLRYCKKESMSRSMRPARSKPS